MAEIFDWSKFWEEFPFTETSSFEKRYQDKINDALQGLLPEDKKLLLDLLELQCATFIEQLELLKDKNKIDSNIWMNLELLYTRLQIIDNLRFNSGLESNGLRIKLLKSPVGSILTAIKSLEVK